MVLLVSFLDGLLLCGEDNLVVSAEPVTLSLWGLFSSCCPYSSLLTPCTHTVAFSSQPLELPMQPPCWSLSWSVLWPTVFHPSQPRKVIILISYPPCLCYVAQNTLPVQVKMTAGLTLLVPLLRAAGGWGGVTVLLPREIQQTLEAQAPAAFLYTCGSSYKSPIPQMASQ